MGKFQVTLLGVSLATTMALLAGCAANTTAIRKGADSTLSSTPAGDTTRESDQSVIAAEQDAEQGLVADEANSAPFEEIVCERIERTGSHRVQRVCYTVVQSEENERENRNAMDRLNRNNGCVAGCSAGVKKSLENLPN